ncbi:MAG: AI-2E family transporter [Fimbriimonadales bacterium]|nr:AI-2E family transporter [Fimbriimonadales bacterium]
MELAQRYRHAAWLILGLAVLAVGALIVRPFVPALVWALVLSILTQPIYDRVRRRVGDSLGAVVSVLAAVLFVGLPMSVVGAFLYVQILEALQAIGNQSTATRNSFQVVLDGITKAVAPVLRAVGQDGFSLTDWVARNREMLMEAVRQPLGQAAVGMGKAVFTAVVALLTMFFMLRDGHQLREPAIDLSPLTREQTEALFARIGQTVRAVFVGIILVAVAQGLAAGAGYFVAGVPNPLVWTLVTILLCAIPLLGSPLVYVPLGVTLITQGRPIAGVALMAYGFVVVSNIDNLLRPFVIGAQTNLHPMAVFFSLLGGVFLLGPVGLMAGPLVLTIALCMAEALREARREALSAGPGAAASPPRPGAPA